MPTEVTKFYVQTRLYKKAQHYVRDLSRHLPPAEQKDFLDIPIECIPNFRKNMLLATGEGGKKLFWINLRSRVIRGIERG